MKITKDAGLILLIAKLEVKNPMKTEDGGLGGGYRTVEGDPSRLQAG